MSQPTPNQLQDLINSKVFQIGTALTGAQGTTVASGSVLYTDANGALKAEGDNLYYDDVNDRVGVRTRSPQGVVHIDQDSVTGAVPVLYLDQDDKSEEFIRFEGDPNGDIMTQTLVGGGDATTFTSKGWLRVNVVSSAEGRMSSGAYYIAVGLLT